MPDDDTEQAAPEAGSRPTGGRPAASAPHAGLSALEDLAERPVGEHVEVYQLIHEQLQADLASIDGA